jgi:pimeloyl-ACP methyl ester carboxylesterase
VSIILLHGFNVADGGRNSVRKLEPYIEGVEIAPDYGWTGVIGLRCANRRAIETIGPTLKRGDVLIGHSNGALICWELAIRYPNKIAGVIVINPALRRDTLWPESLPVMCVHNATDWVVELGRMWARLVSLGGLNFHGWGAAGRHGFTSRQARVRNWDSSKGLISKPVRGHSGLFKRPQVEPWGELMGAMAFSWKEAHKK